MQEATGSNPVFSTLLIRHLRILVSAFLFPVYSTLGYEQLNALISGTYN